MNISLTPELEAMIKRKVDSGLYNNASEVIREALRLMNEQDRINAMKLQLLKAEIETAWQQADRGEFVHCTPESIIAKADACMASHNYVVTARAEADLVDIARYTRSTSMLA
jgi:putative addiction module antidote protein, CC2985 family